jgi:hypothetical protein
MNEVHEWLQRAARLHNAFMVNVDLLHLLPLRGQLCRTPASMNKLEYKIHKPV